MNGKTVLGKTMGTWMLALALALFLAAPALAHHEDGHSQGGGSTASKGSKGSAKSGSGERSADSVTEDEDNDGQPNSYSGGDSQHPSGKDRHIENGKSGNQGKSPSSPDDSKGPMRYEGEKGADKPTTGDGSRGGGENVYDQDGNNGCGNDQDFDDDNNGWCGGKPKNSKPKQPRDPGSPGNSSSDMTVSVDCYSVGVTSSKDISFVEITFADGTSVKFEGLQGYSYTNSFDKPLASASAKSGTTVVSGVVSRDCNAVVPPATCPDGSPMTVDGTCDASGDEAIEACPEGALMDEEGACVLGETIERDEDPAQPAVGPAAEAGPSVLGLELAQALTEPVTVAGAILPFTGTGLATIVLTALGLVGAGAVLIRKR